MELVIEMTYWFILLASLQFACALPGFGIAGVSAARQKRVWQKETVKAILRQNVGWYDTSNPERLASEIGKNFELIMKGLDGPTYGIFVAVGASATGIIGGLLESWSVALVVLAVSPIILLSAICLAQTLGTSTRRQNKAYAVAGGIATECLFAMRTVAALGLEKTFGERYAGALGKARNTMISARCQLGIATGFLFSTFILLQAVGFAYGGLRFAEDLRRSEYTYVVNKTQEFCIPHPVMPSLPNICQNVTLEMHWCKFAGPQ